MHRPVGGRRRTDPTESNIFTDYCPNRRIMAIRKTGSSAGKSRADRKTATKQISAPDGRVVWLVASGDLRLSANQVCWPAQRQMEAELGEAVRSLGWTLRRAHEVDSANKHGFIASQAQGMRVFQDIPAAVPLVVAEAVWQYSHHVLAGLTTHRGPILTVANWSGTWPGLVGLLNLNGSLTKAGVAYSSLWTEDFADPQFRRKLEKWLRTGRLIHPISHVRDLAQVAVPRKARGMGAELASELRTRKAIMGVLDEGCMGMYNAIIPDHLLHATGVFKERLSQSALYHETMQVSDAEADSVRRWLERRGLRFVTGPRHATDLTDAQIRRQCKMYIGAVRMADDFGCESIGIQYQQGLKDLLPASDLVEGMLNNEDRPPVRSRDGRRVLYEGRAIPHFNEVDECAGLDAMLIHRVHRALGQPVETTLHDLRWGDVDRSGTVPHYVWVFLISGSAPPAHFVGGWKGASSERQPPMYFPSGGGTLKGISKPGEIIWSRIFVADDRLHIDMGRGQAVALPAAETERRWQATTPQWPIMHAVIYGASRDAMMARHKSNHIQVVYADSAAAADHALLCRAAMADALGIRVHLCGTRKNAAPWPAL
jgi:hypothetical protein